MYSYFRSRQVQLYDTLTPEIVNAELERFSEKKHYHIASLDRLTSRLYCTCKRLENSNSNMSDYVPILRSELRKFRQLQRSWMLSL